MQKCPIFFVMLFVGMGAYAQFPVQIKYQEGIGRAKVLQTNGASIGSAGHLGIGWWGDIHAEYPLGSNHEHVDIVSLWLGGIKDDDTLCSVGWASSRCEFWPTENDWDTIWVAGINNPDTEHGQRGVDDDGDGLTDEEFLNGFDDDGDGLIDEDYAIISEQDFIAHYADYYYGAATPCPGSLEVYQVSYCWSYTSVQDIIFYDFYILNRSNTAINDFYFGLFCNSAIGDMNIAQSYSDPWGVITYDDYSQFDGEKQTVWCMDGPGGKDGYVTSPMGWSILSPDFDTLSVTYLNFFGWENSSLPANLQLFPEGEPGVDMNRPLRYRLMSSGITCENQTMMDAVSHEQGAQWLLAFGPYEFEPTDTIKVTTALVFGEDEPNFWNNVEEVHKVYERDFRFSPPPPPPEVTIVPGDRKLTLRWTDAPEATIDTLRHDSIWNDFEGYRVYKSTKGTGGPYTLIAEFDKINWYGYNTGLEHEYIDSGLVNGIAYYYAVTSFDLPDTVEGTASKESGIFVSAKQGISGNPAGAGKKVAVVPNPYRGDVDYTEDGWEVPTYAPTAGWTERDRRIQFINLSAHCTIRVYTLTGDLVKTIEHNDSLKGWEDWNLISRVNQAISSGIYIFSVEDQNTGDIQLGKFVVIK